MNPLDIDRAYAQRLRDAGIERADAILARNDGEIAAWSRSTDTVRIAACGAQPGFFLKRYHYPSWRRRLRCAFRGAFFGLHRAESERRLLNEMRLLGIPAVRPVAVGATRRLHFVTSCFLVTEDVPGSQNLTSFALQLRAGRIRMSDRQRQETAKLLAGEVASMHASGFCHGQPFWRNILIRVVAGEPEFFFLDARPRRGGRWAAKNGDWWIEELAQLNASARPFMTRSERLRFFKCYLAARGMPAEAVRRAAQIEGMSQRWSAHEAQRIRMSARFDEWRERLQLEQQRQMPPAANADRARAGQGPA